MLHTELWFIDNAIGVGKECRADLDEDRGREETFELSVGKHCGCTHFILLELQNYVLIKHIPFQDTFFYRDYIMMTAPFCFVYHLKRTLTVNNFNFVGPHQSNSLNTTKQLDIENLHVVSRNSSILKGLPRSAGLLPTFTPDK